MTHLEITAMNLGSESVFGMARGPIHPLEPPRFDATAAVAAQLEQAVMHALHAALERLRCGDTGAAVPAPPPRVPASAPQASSLPGPLTSREHEVLRLIAEGHSNKVIARALALSPHTVKRHVANILDKIGVGSRAQAAAWLHNGGPGRA